MGLIFGTMHLVKRFGLESPEYATIIRIGYAIATSLILGFTFYVKSMIQSKNDTTALEYDDATPGSQAGRIVTTVCKYDLSEVAKLQKSSLFTVAIVMFMHFKFGYIQPLILQSILPLFNLYKNPLFQVHILAKPAVDSLARPWVPENPFAALTGNNNDTSASTAGSSNASAAAPAADASASETRKDK
ncbi:phosphate transporter (Pho88) [Dipsacomyces acuminosporus]|nr:phosphate transporter (Pho88) [Dipsacomyces acuminosporus]